MSIRYKLIACFLATVALPTLLLTALVNRETRSEYEQTFESAAVRQMRLVDQFVNRVIDMVKDNVRYLAADSVYQEVNDNLRKYFGSEPGIQPESDVERLIARELQRFVASHPDIPGAYFGSADGGFVGIVSGPLKDYDPRTRPWYITAVREAPRTIVSPAYISPGNLPMISVARAVLRADGTLIGVVSVDLSLEQLTSLVESARFGETGYMMLIEGTGTVLANPSERAFLFRNVSSIQRTLFQALADQSDGRRTLSDNGISKEIVTLTSEQGGWRYATIINTAEIFAPIRQLDSKIWSIALLMAFVFTAAGIFIATRIVSPINQVSDYLSRIARSEAESLNDLRIQSADEIGTLTRRINEVLQFERDRQIEMLRSQKLEAVGQLAAGIAHEINTPSQYVSDNVSFLCDAINDLLPVLEQFPECVSALKSSGIGQEKLARFEDALATVDLSFIRDEIPAALGQSREGLQQIAMIVRAMKEFSHPGKDVQFVDLNEAIRSTVTVARNEWKYVAEVDLDLDNSVPEIECVPSLINQALLNLLVNAAHAISDANAETPTNKGRIDVRTRCLDDHVEISVSDTGTGIPSEIIGRIFDPFFTTKDVGKGTGQGLSLVHHAIVRQHQGKVDVHSQEGGGTTFTIVLPVNFSGRSEAEAA